MTIRSVDVIEDTIEVIDEKGQIVRLPMALLYGVGGSLEPKECVIADGLNESEKGLLLFQTWTAVKNLMEQRGELPTDREIYEEASRALREADPDAVLDPQFLSRSPGQNTTAAVTSEARDLYLRQARRTLIAQKLQKLL